jgi:hypothetical protein
LIFMDLYFRQPDEKDQLWPTTVEFLLTGLPVNILVNPE